MDFGEIWHPGVHSRSY